MPPTNHASVQGELPLSHLLWCWSHLNTRGSSMDSDGVQEFHPKMCHLDFKLRVVWGSSVHREGLSSISLRASGNSDVMNPLWGSPSAREHETHSQRWDWGLSSAQWLCHSFSPILLKILSSFFQIIYFPLSCFPPSVRYRNFWVSLGLGVLTAFPVMTLHRITYPYPQHPFFCYSACCQFISQSQELNLQRAGGSFPFY